MSITPKVQVDPSLQSDPTGDGRCYKIKQSKIDDAKFLSFISVQ